MHLKRQDNLILTSGKFKLEESFWMEKLAGVSALSGFPIEYTRPPLQEESCGEVVERTLDATVAERLLKIANGSSQALYMVLVTGVFYLINRYSEQQDLVIGMPVLTQHTDDLINRAVALRVGLDVKSTFKELLLQVKTAVLEAGKHQNYPFLKLAEQLGLPNAEPSMPQFQTIVSLDDLHHLESANRLQPDTHLAFQRAGQELRLCITYRQNLYARTTVERIADHLLAYYAAITQNPGVRLLDIEVLSETERHTLMTAYNDAAKRYEYDRSVSELFERHAVAQSEHIALTFEGRHLSYAKLNEQANQLAWYLREREIGIGHVVGVKMARSLEQVVAMLAILKTGAAYVPIDPDYPEERIRYLLNTAQASVLLVNRDETDETGEAEAVNVLRVLERDDLPTSNLGVPNDPDRPIYVLFTSGSTGNPKGVRVKMHSYVNLLTWFTQEFSFGPADTLLQIAPNSFDLAQKNIFGPLVSGARLCLYSPGPFDYQKMSDLIEQERITIINCAPSAAYPLVDFNEDTDYRRLRSVTRLFVGGEPINVPKLRPWFVHPNCNALLINTYGPTEATDVVSYHRVTRREIEEVSTVPIGIPVYNDHLYVLDEHLRLLPPGMIGQLYVGGVGVSLGYYNRPDLTAEKFVDAPAFPGGRLYMTGDRVRWREDGVLEYFGRIDHQLKIRGMRLEAGEIEEQLLRVPAIREAVVVDRKDATGDAVLCGYYVAGEPIEEADVRAALARRLPSFMIPTHLVPLERLPLTPNGKTDRKALPDPQFVCSATGEHAMPANKWEADLLEIWQSVIGQQAFGVTDTFMSLGGHSLQAMTIVSRIYKRFKVNVPLRELFERQTIRAVASLIETEKTVERPPLERVAPQEVYPVSSAQQRMLVLQHFEGDSTAYNMPECIKIEGPLDSRRLQTALSRLIERHESLRTSFEWRNGEAVQRIHAEVKLPYAKHELEEAELPAYALSFVQPFDLQKAPLFRTELLQLGTERHALLLDLHHIITDGISHEILMDELMRLYQGETPADVSFQYKDYTVWQNRLQADGYLREQEAYWLEQLASDPAVLNLPTDFPRPAMKSFAGDVLTFAADEALTRRLQQLAIQTGTTPYMVLLAVFACLLAAYAGQEEIMIGSPTAGRAGEELDGTVGMFVNMLPMRIRVQGNETFSGLLQQVKQIVLNGMDNQEYPFDKIVEKLGLQGEASRNPLFDVVFAMQNHTFSALGTEDLTCTLEPIFPKTSKFDLVFQAIEREGRLDLSFEYCTDLFTPVTMQRMAERLLNLLQAVVQAGEQAITELDMLSAEEKQRLIHTFNDTASDYPATQTVVDLFEEQARTRPDAVALQQDGVTMTYGELNAQANRLARHLQQLGIQPGQFVGISLDRSFHLIIGMLAILKTGAAYVPLGAEFPQQRLAFMLEDSAAALVLTEQRYKERFSEQQVEAICLDELDLSRTRADNLSSLATPDSVAYIIYTSGSTGTPKGVLIPHRGIARLVKANDYADFSESHVFLQFASISFDAATFEIWGPLLNGAKLLLFPAGSRDISHLAELLMQGEVTTLLLTTSVFHLLVDHHLDSLEHLHQLLVGGEAMLSSHARRAVEALPNCRILNVYGPTETTVFASTFTLNRQNITGDTVLIGQAIRNTDLYVLNRAGKLQPIGLPGELCTGGPGLALGYLNRPELTAEKWIKHPFSSDPHAKLYRTGDLVRRLPDGNLEYLGRIDNQVKFRGYRIELGEVEVAITRQPDVEQAVVQLQGEGIDKRLVAYVVLKKGSTLSVADLRRHLLAEMPEYMVPSLMQRLAAIPLNPSGKLDRNRLPAFEDVQSPAAPSEPTLFDALEWRLYRLWQELLHNQAIELTDSFFDLGGHSILALRLCARVQEEWGYHLSLRTLLQNPTIQRLAAVLRTEQPDRVPSPLIPLETQGTQAPLFLVHPIGGGALCYIELAKQWAADRPVYALQATSLDRNDEPWQTVEQLAADYLAAIKEVQPQGPYALGGWSFGGVVAYEMAQQLRSGGEEVAWLTLIDSGLPQAEAFDETAVRHAFAHDILGLYKNPDALAELPSFDQQQLARMYQAFQNNWRAFHSYEPRPYFGDIQFVLATASAEAGTSQNAYGWERFVRGRLDRIEIAGDHFALLKHPQVEQLAERLRRTWQLVTVTN